MNEMPRKKITQVRKDKSSGSLNRRIVKQTTMAIGNQTGSDNLYDGKTDHGSGRAIKTSRRYSRRPNA